MWAPRDTVADPGTSLVSLLLTICGASSLMVARALAAPLRANSAVVRVPFPLPTYGEPVCEAFRWYCADSPIPCEGHDVGHDA